MKGHGILIHAMSHILKVIPETKLMIVGEGKMEQELKALVKNLQIENGVFFYPTSNHTNEYLPLFDIFVMPSYREACSRTLQEAMASGCSVVASSSGANREIIEDGKDGYIFRDGNRDDLLRILKMLVSDPDMRSRAGIDALEKVKRVFAIRDKIREIYRIYQGLI